jgi:hypothetical protein
LIGCDISDKYPERQAVVVRREVDGLDDVIVGRLKKAVDFQEPDFIVWSACREINNALDSRVGGQMPLRKPSCERLGTLLRIGPDSNGCICGVATLQEGRIDHVLKIARVELTKSLNNLLSSRHVLASDWKEECWENATSSHDQ